MAASHPTSVVSVQIRDAGTSRAATAPFSAARFTLGFLLVEACAAIDKSRVLNRLPAFIALLLPAACSVSEQKLPTCWINKSFNEGQRVAGRVTILISDQMDGLMDGPSIFVSPLTCERGSFLVENPPSSLTKLRRPWTDDRPLFGSVYEADISGTVRLIQRQHHAGGYASPYSIVISNVDKLKSVQHPRWWKP